MSVRDNLIAARAVIENPDNWGKGAINNNGCRCALGALVEARAFHNPEIETLVHALPEPWRSVARFKDAETTIHSDIIALFDRAIEAAGDK